MNGFRGARLVALREIRERVRARTFLISTGLIVLIAFGAVGAATVLPDFFEDDPPTIVLVRPDVPDGVASLLEGGALGSEARVLFVASEAEARRLLLNGSIDAALLGGPTLAFRSDVSPTIEALVNQAVRIATLPDLLADLDLTVEDAAPLIDPQPLPIALLEPAAADDTSDSDRVIASAAVILLLMSLTLYGAWILNGVVEEKTSRVVEVLMGALRPWQLLLGKVTGILLLAVAQLVAATTAAVVAISALGTADLPEVGIEVGIAALTYLTLGLLLYSFVFAAAGATVSRQEDAQTATMPISLTLVGIYMLSLTVVVNNADSTFSRVLSIVPISSPLAMTPRIATGNPPAWEIALSIVLLLVAIPIVINLAGRIYAGAILRGGPRIGLREAWRSARETR